MVQSGTIINTNSLLNRAHNYQCDQQAYNQTGQISSAGGQIPDLLIRAHRQAKAEHVTASRQKKRRGTAKIQERPSSLPPDLTPHAAVSTEARTSRRQAPRRRLVQLLVGDVPALGGRRRVLQLLVLLVVVDEEDVEAAEGGGGGHRPDEELDGERHDLGDLVGEHDGEQRGERPDGGLDPLPARGVAVEALVEAQAGEEGHEVEVGDGDEDDGPRVAVGAVDGHAGVEGQEDEP